MSVSIVQEALLSGTPEALTVRLFDVSLDLRLTLLLLFLLLFQSLLLQSDFLISCTLFLCFICDIVECGLKTSFGDGVDFGLIKILPTSNVDPTHVYHSLITFALCSLSCLSFPQLPLLGALER